MSWGTEFPKSVCLVEGCGLPIKGVGYCNKHYQLFRRNGKPEKLIKQARSHPLYISWFEKKQNKRLCDEWMEFKTFCEGVGEKPEGNFILRRLDKTKLYGPDNFEWYEHLKKEENESNKEWWARKWANARSRNPEAEYDRNLKRSFGENFGLIEWWEKFDKQNGVCAICNEPETSINRNGSVRRLAVDHCHAKDKVRALLCNRCNTTLGKVGDSVELLKKMIDYLIEHNKDQ